MTKRKAIVLVADQKQFPPAVFLASRLASMNTRPDVDVILATESNQALSEARVFGGDFDLLDIQGVYDHLDLPTRQHFTRATYYDLFIPKLLERKYNRIIYLDVDTYPESPKLFTLFDLDMGEYPVAAVRDLNVPFFMNSIHDVELAATLKLPKEKFLGAKYLNGGVLLVDLAAFKQERIEKKVLRLLSEKSIAPLYADQTILNAVLRARWLELSPSFNMTRGTSTSFVGEFAPPAIIHFTGPKKPWHRPFADDHPIRRELAAFLRDTPWSGFILQNNPLMLGPDDQLRPAEPRGRYAPDWQGTSLEAVVQFLRHTSFADVEQGLTVLNYAALTQEGGARNT